MNHSVHHLFSYVCDGKGGPVADLFFVNKVGMLFFQVVVVGVYVATKRYTLEMGVVVLKGLVAETSFVSRV
jgi:hypothetical protein